MAVAPVDVEALSSMQLDHLLRKDVHCCSHCRRREASDHFVQSKEVDVVSGVECRRDSEDIVCSRVASSQDGAVLDVVDPDSRSRQSV